MTEIMANTEGKTHDARLSDPKLVDSIVREVLARLASQRPSEKSAAAAAPAQLVLEPAVISVATLADRLSGVQRVVVGRKAVVTPAARDLLKQHNITLSRSAQTAIAGKPTLTVAVCDTAVDPAALLRSVAPLASNIERLAKTGMSTVVVELCDAVVKDGRRGLLLSGQPTVACCLANRRPGVRAAVAHDRDEVAAAAASLGMNLLVIDPARRSLFQLGQMVKQFLQAGAVHCPEHLKAQLG
ncbi:MAG TPA: RpiB/LacA/LacB family sugar-phosphate isomerase [Pirellulales bacterium]|nr:RpiB/LacA/LacB family sugar-phosphate isomerase [Pirellulales bacterium]